MAENLISALVSKIEVDRFKRDCADPKAKPGYARFTEFKIATLEQAPDEVTVNGVRFVRGPGE